MAKIKNLKHRDGFTFFKSYDDICSQLNDKQFVLFMRTILDVQFLRIKYDDVRFDDNILKLLWASVRYNVTSQVDGYLSNIAKNKDQFMGVYDNANGGSNGGSNEPLCQGEVKGEVEGEVKEKDNKAYRLDTLPQNKKEELYSFMKEHIKKENISSIEIEKFTDYWISMSGSKATKKDWKATFRNWCRNDWVKKNENNVSSWS